MPGLRLSLFALLVVGTLAACGDKSRPPSISLGDRDPLLDDCATVGYQTYGMISYMIHGVDILVVVDNSMSMEEEQSRLVEAVPLLVESLLDPADEDGDTRPDHRPVQDLHIGVVSTDMGTGGYSLGICSDPVDGDDGILLHTPDSSSGDCDPAYPTYLSYESEEPDSIGIEWLTSGFPCIASLGSDGCGWEQPLKAAARALIDHRDGVNAGFLRPESMLVILFISDEDDCSVAPGSEGIFDTTDASLGHLDLRCFNHPEMVEPVSTYITAFQSLRAAPEKMMLGFIVGVPPGEQCEGDGIEISSCLEHPDMIERVDMPTTSLLPACTSSSGLAPPGRRFVQIAGEFGESAIVQSVCADDYGPAMVRLAEEMQPRIDTLSPVSPWHQMNPANDPEDPCRCLGSCRYTEYLSDLRSCDTEAKPCWEPDGPGTGCADPFEDPDGLLHTLCEIPQAGTRMTPCSPDDAPSCDDPGVTHSPDGEGWYFMDLGWTDDSGTPTPAPQILFTEGMEPEEGSNLDITCNPDCYGPSTGTTGSGGEIGTACDPLVCPGPDCLWFHSFVYFAESLECEGGACLVFRQSWDIDAYCSRRCGPGADERRCPEGFTCYAPLGDAHEDPGCWCVDENSLSHPDRPYTPDSYGVDACR